MKKITYLDSQKFGKIAENTINKLKEIRENNFVFSFNYNQLCDAVERAKFYNKTNNMMVKNEWYGDPVYKVNCLDTESKILVYIGINPNKNNNIKQMFIYEILKSQYATKQEFSHFKN